MKHVNVIAKSTVSAKVIIVGMLPHATRHLKHIANNLVIACDGTIYFMDIVLTNMANTILLTAISLLHSHFRVNVEWAASLT